MELDRNHKINVFLYASSSPEFEFLLENPPLNINYSSNIKREFNYNLKYSYGNTLLKNISRSLMSNFKIPRIYPFKNFSCDIFHSTRGFIPLFNNSYIIEFEHPASFYNLDHKFIYDPIKIKILRKIFASEKCKFLIAWSDISKALLMKMLKSKLIEKKILVVHPTLTIPKQAFKKRNINNNKKLRILFIGRFIQKGGLISVMAFKRIQKKFNIEMTMITRIPPIFKKWIDKIENLTIIEPTLSRSDLFSLYYLKNDIFLYPSYGDTYSLVLIEAMLSGMSIISSDVFAIPEIIENDIDGRIVHSKFSEFKLDGRLNTWATFENTKHFRHTYIKDISNSLVDIIENDTLRKKFARNCKQKVESGILSIPYHKRIFSKIYDLSL